jgi:hypothetical protein
MSHLEYDKALTLSDGTKLPHLQKDYNLYFRKSTILYGVSKTGKTTIIKEILKLLLNHIPIATVFCPSNEANKSYDGIIPPMFIHKDLKRQQLSDIWAEQEKKARLYTLCNDETMLRRIIDCMQNYPDLASTYYSTTRVVESINLELKEKVKRIESGNFEQYQDKLDMTSKITDKAKDYIISIYKKAIKDKRNILLTLLTDKSLKSIVSYLDINPNLLLIFDDCIDEIEVISKKSKGKDGELKASVIDTIFQRGRHAYVTCIITAQNDIKINTTLRRNAFISIFTEPESANHFFNGKANSFSKEKIKRAIYLSNFIFADKSKSNFKKLVYDRLGNEEEMFSYIVANFYAPFRFGHPTYWKLSEKYKSGEEDETKNFLENI